jgi:hypothetical protein
MGAFLISDVTSQFFIGKLKTMANDNLQTLTIICDQLSRSGVTPTVGLVRSKAPFKVSVPEAIDAIKRYKSAHGNRVSDVAETNTVSTDEKSDLSHRVSTLEEQVKVLQRQLAQLSESR